MDEDFGYTFFADLSFAHGFESFYPPARAKTPLCPVLEANLFAEVVAIGGGEVEKLICDDASNGVVAWVVWPCPTVAIALVTCHWRLGEECQRLSEH